MSIPRAKGLKHLLGPLDPNNADTVFTIPARSQLVTKLQYKQRCMETECDSCVGKLKESASVVGCGTRSVAIVAAVIVWQIFCTC